MLVLLSSEAGNLTEGYRGIVEGGVYAVLQINWCREFRIHMQVFAV